MQSLRKPEAVLLDLRNLSRRLHEIPDSQRLTIGPLSNLCLMVKLTSLFYILKGGAGSGNIGHAGRIGHRGGSAPKGVLGLVSAMSRGVMPYQGDNPGAASFASRDESGKITFIKPFESDRILDTVANELSKQTGIELDKVRNYISGPGKANNVTADSLQTKKVAEELFGSKLSDHEKEKLTEFKGTKTKLSDAEVKSIMRVVYKNTQTQLSKLGIKKLTVYRRTDNPTTNALESWTLDPDTFKTTASPHHSRPLIEKTVDVKDIYSIAGFGPGNFHNFEITVLGNRG